MPTVITELNKINISTLPNDQGYTYPIDLADFRLTVPTGSTQRIKLVFQNCATDEKLIARKFLPRTGQYTTLENAQIEQTSFNGKPAILLSYDATDGGVLDDDGVANGVIVDPVGLAFGQSAAGDTQGAGLANTGEDIYPLVTIMLALLVSGFYATYRWCKYNV